jgi:hypothetical protein
MTAYGKRYYSIDYDRGVQIRADGRHRFMDENPSLWRDPQGNVLAVQPHTQPYTFVLQLVFINGIPFNVRVSQPSLDPVLWWEWVDD